MNETLFYDYSFTTQTPLLVGTQDGDPNSVLTAVAVPGSAVRGAMARALASHAAFDRVVLSGAVRFLPAVPAGPGPARTLPVPKAWRADKLDPARVHDALVAPPDGTSQWTGVRASFVTTGAEAMAVVPGLATAFHHQRDRRMGRATEGAGAVFLYEAVEPGTPFVGTVAITGVEAEREEMLDAIRTAISRPMQIGRSKAGGYGGGAVVTLHDVPRPREFTHVDVPDLLREGRDIAPGKRFRLLLTSPAIVRDPRTGQLDASALGPLVVQALGGRVSVAEIAVAATTVAGFNATWGKPLPHAVAAAAGSVVVFEALESIAVRDLVAIEQRGIGERRQDGYGGGVFVAQPTSPRVAFKVARSMQGSVPVPATRPDRDGGAMLELLERRLLEAAVERNVEHVAARAAQGASKPLPSRALLGRLRNAMRSDEWSVTLTTWLDEKDKHPDRLRKPARDALKACRLDGGQYLDDWLRSLVRDANPFVSRAEPEGLAERLFPGDSLDRWRIDLAGDRHELRRQLAERSRRQIGDRVLALLAKQSRDA